MPFLLLAVLPLSWVPTPADTATKARAAARVVLARLAAGFGSVVLSLASLALAGDFLFETIVDATAFTCFDFAGVFDGDATVAAAAALSAFAALAASLAAALGVFVLPHTCGTP